MQKRYTLLLFLQLLFITAYSQTQVSLDQIIQSTIKGDNTAVEVESYIHQCQTVDQLWEIESQLAVDDKDIRYLLYHLLDEIGQKTSNEELKSRVVYLLVDNGLVDDDQANTGRCLELLMAFAPADFNTACRNRLGSIVISSKSHIPALIRLSGYIRLTSLLPFLTDRLTTTKDSEERWAIAISLARMGDLEQINNCLSKVKRMGINDQVIQYILPDLVFIENRSCFDYLVESIMTDNMSCSSFDPDKSEQVNCAFRLMELVAPYIVDFPVKVQESGDLDATDLDAALLSVREWILQNRNQYHLVFE